MRPITAPRLPDPNLEVWDALLRSIWGLVGVWKTKRPQENVLRGFGLAQDRLRGGWGTGIGRNITPTSAKLEPSWGQHEPRMSQLGPIWGQHVAKVDYFQVVLRGVGCF